MKTISVSVSIGDYDAFKRAAKRKGRPVAQLIRDAMAFYREEKLEDREELTDLPTFPGHQNTGPLPARWETWGEILEKPTLPADDPGRP